MSPEYNVILEIILIFLKLRFLLNKAANALNYRTPDSRLIPSFFARMRCYIAFTHLLTFHGVLTSQA